jgi:hypothetical protein
LNQFGASSSDKSGRIEERRQELIIGAADKSWRGKMRAAGKLGARRESLVRA